MNKLSIPAIKAVVEPGMYGDGGGLWLHVGPARNKSWIFRYMLDGKAREMGLGPLHTISLAQARQRAGDQRRLKLDGLDPLTLRHAKREAAKIEAAIHYDWFSQKGTAEFDAAWEACRAAMPVRLR